MKTWWTQTGWPWLKGNWWVLLIFPLMLIVALGMGLTRLFRQRTVVIDPTEAADERARLEADTRAQLLEVERSRLRKELAGLHEEYEKLRLKHEERLRREVEVLRDDPDKLRELMLETGR